MALLISEVAEVHSYNSICFLNMPKLYLMICGALVQFGCYQHRYELNGLWCSSIVWLHSINTRVHEGINAKASSIILLSLKLTCNII